MDSDERKQLTELLNQAAAEAEAVQDLRDDGAPLPAHVTASRPNR